MRLTGVANIYGFGCISDRLCETFTALGSVNCNVEIWTSLFNAGCDDLESSEKIRSW